ADRVHLVIRGESLERSMSRYLIEQIGAVSSIRVHPYTEVAGAEGDSRLERLTLRDVRTGATEMVKASWLFIFIGAEPRTDWLDGVVARDRRGFVLTGPDLTAGGARPPGWLLQRDPYHLETNVPGV